MATRTATAVVRADVVGSLLRPEYLREARDAARAGTFDAGELSALEDRAVLEAIALQENAGIGAITDGEYRRNGWIALIPIVDDPHLPAARERLRVPRRGVGLARPLEDGCRRAGRYVGAAAAGAVRHAPSRGRPRHRRGRVRVPEGERHTRAPSTRSPRRAGTGSTGTRTTRATRIRHPMSSSATSPASCASTSSTGSSSSAATTSRSTRPTTRSGTSTRATVRPSRSTVTTWRTSSSRTPSSTAWSSRG